MECSIIRAIQKGYYRQVRILVALGYCINEKDSEGRTPLIHCALIEEEEWGVGLARTFLETGTAQIGLMDKRSMNALHYACLCNRTGLISVMLNHVDYNIHSTDLLGNNPMHYCAANGNLAAVEMLAFLSSGLAGHPCSFITPNLIGHTPISLCEYFGHERCERYLANLNVNRVGGRRVEPRCLREELTSIERLSKPINRSSLRTKNKNGHLNEALLTKCRLHVAHLARCYASYSGATGVSPKAFSVPLYPMPPSDVCARDYCVKNFDEAEEEQELQQQQQQQQVEEEDQEEEEKEPRGSSNVVSDESKGSNGSRAKRLDEEKQREDGGSHGDQDEDGGHGDQRQRRLYGNASSPLTIFAEAKKAYAADDSQVVAIKKMREMSECYLSSVLEEIVYPSAPERLPFTEKFLKKLQILKDTGLFTLDVLKPPAHRLSPLEAFKRRRYCRMVPGLPTVRIAPTMNQKNHVTPGLDAIVYTSPTVARSKKKLSKEISIGGLWRKDPSEDERKYLNENAIARLYDAYQHEFTYSFLRSFNVEDYVEGVKEMSESRAKVDNDEVANKVNTALSKKIK